MLADPVDSQSGRPWVKVDPPSVLRVGRLPGARLEPERTTLAVVCRHQLKSQSAVTGRAALSRWINDNERCSVSGHGVSSKAMDEPKKHCPNCYAEWPIVWDKKAKCQVVLMMCACYPYLIA